MKTAAKLFMIVVGSVLLLTFLASAPPSSANGHREGKKHFRKHHWEKEYRHLGEILGRGHDEGNETTGQMVAWGLAVANVTVVISLIIRAIRRFAPLRRNVKNSIWKFNSLQKKYLMRLHYVLNPLILAVALLHWMLSKCVSTSLPEWGLLTMCVMVALGIILKFRLCPQTILRRVYKLHTQPILVLILISMLVIGHLAVD